MRILYVAPRYHTNQIPVMQGWLENGHHVCFLSQYAGTPEDYTVLHPVILGYSVLFERFMTLYRVLFCRKEKSAKKEFDLRIKAGFPPFGKARKHIREFEPDIVIVRERSVYNIPFVLVCRRKKIPCILYNQSPLWDRRKENRIKQFLLTFLPKVRMTPVMGTADSGKEMTPYTVFVPFVTERYVSPDKKAHFLDDKVQILCVGRYEQRKNLFLLLDAIQDLAGTYRLHLSIVGEATDENQSEYYKKLDQTVIRNHLEQDVTLFRNLNREQMYEAYKKADLFVLPSTKERASITQLEAMGCSLPVICSDTNGSACYVESGRNGWLFRDNDKADLKDKIESLVCDRELLLRMGQESHRLAREKYCFDNYYKSVMQCIEECKHEMK